MPGDLGSNFGLADFDPLFSSEDRLKFYLRNTSGLRRWGSSWWSSSIDVGVALSLLLVLFGFRERLRAAQQTAAQLVRVASRDAIRLASNAATRLRTSRSNNALQDLPPEPAAPNGQAPPPHLQSAVSLSSAAGRSQGWKAFWLNFIERHIDTGLLALLGYKLGLLVLYTMPLSYGFGIKRRFLKWASQSPVFRLYLRLAPVVGLATVAAASGVVRWSALTPDDQTVQRWRMLALLNTVLTYCTVRLFELIRGDPTPVFQVEETALDRDILSQQPPPRWLGKAITGWYNRMCPAQFLGLENLPKEGKRLLFVGNHVLWGLDVPLLLEGLAEHAGIWARPLGEHAWFSVPIVGEMLHALGGVDGTRHNCDLLMSRGDCLLVYPGGARESWKRTTDEKYAVLWGQNTLGFVRMAVRHGYHIVPIATVGTEDVFVPVADLPIQQILTAGGLFKAPKAGASKAFEADQRFPLVMPRPRELQRTYYRIMPPVSTAEYQGRDEDEELLRCLRDEARSRLEAGVKELLEHRKNDPERFTLASRRRLALESGEAPGPSPSTATPTLSRL